MNNSERNIYGTYCVAHPTFKLDNFTNQISVLEIRTFSGYPSPQLSLDKAKVIDFLQNIKEQQIVLMQIEVRNT